MNYLYLTATLCNFKVLYLLLLYFTPLYGLKYLFIFFAAVKNPDIVQDIHDKLWELLPAFCCYPTDGCKNFGALTKVLISCAKESFMLQNVANALQVCSQRHGFLPLFCS